MADVDAIATALLARVATLSVGSPALPIAYPEIAFTPPADGKWLEVAIFYNQPKWQGLTSGRMDQGLLQVTVVWPKNLGVPAPLRHAQDVIDHFPKGLTLTGNVRVQGQPYASSPFVDAADVRVPITIPWAA